MALTVTEITKQVDGVETLAKQLKTLYKSASQVISNINAEGTDWENLPEGSVDANGNVTGKTCTPEEISDVLDASQSILGWWNQGTPTNGTKVERLCDPIV